MEIPPGPQEVVWKLVTSGTEIAGLDQVQWVPTPPAGTVPTAAEAVELTENISLPSLGNWVPLAWADVGAGNDDALGWTATTYPETGQPLIAEVTGPGWFTWSMLSTFDGGVLTSVDGTPTVLGASAPYTATVAGVGNWNQIAQWLDAGVHMLSWKATDFVPNWTPIASHLRLDGMSMQSAAPSWINALESVGVTQWQMSNALWPTVMDVTHDGVDALRTPEVQANFSSRLHAKVTGPGRLHFWWRVDDPAPQLESAMDIPSNKFVLSITTTPGAVGGANEVQQTGVWEEVTVNLPEAQEYYLDWIFQRSGRSTLPGDGAWLDEVTFTGPTPTTLGEALDAPELTWTSSGLAQGFTGPSMEAWVGGDAVRRPAGMATGPDEWVETTVPGPGLVFINYRDNIFQGPKCWVDGVAAPVSTGNGGYIVKIYGPGPHTCRCGFNPASTQGGEGMDNFKFTPLPLVSLEEALDTTSVVATVPENAQWINGITNALAAHNGGDVVQLQAASYGGYTTRATLQLKCQGPAQVKFWWRAQQMDFGGRAYVSSATGNAFFRDSSFNWEQVSMVVTGQGDNTLYIQAWEDDTGGLVWIDGVEVEPLLTVSVSEALHAPALNFTQGGAGTWIGQAPPGLAPVAGSYAGIYLTSEATQPAWLETTVTGPGWVKYDAVVNGSTTLTVTRLAAGGISPVTLRTNETAFIPPGTHTVRWTAQRSSSQDYILGSAAVRLSDFSFTPTLSITEALDAPGLTFTTPGASAGVWYGAPKDANDQGRFTGSDLLRVNGSSAEFSFPVIGPGWLRLESAFRFDSQYSGSLGEEKIQVRLLPPAPAPRPNPLPAPAFVHDRFINGYGEASWQHNQIWIPAGAQTVLVSGPATAVLNQLSFTPLLTMEAVREALELPGGGTISLSSETGASLANVTHDGVDALELSPNATDPTTHSTSSAPLLTFNASGPSLITGWVRIGLVSPSQYISPDVRTQLKVSIDGIPLSLEWSEADPNGWRPIRLPLVGSGPHAVGLGLMPEVNQLFPRFTLLLDEFSILPMASVSLETALDTNGLTWTAGGEGVWSGWTSGGASPDATDAAWLFLPPSSNPPSSAWVETTVVGPGRLRYDLHGSNPYWPYPNSWTTIDSLIPAGPQTVRLSVDSESTNLRLFGLDRVKWEPYTEVSIAEALDAVTQNFSPSGRNPTSWKALTAGGLAHDGQDLVVFQGPYADLSDAQLGKLETTVVGPAVVRFWATFNYYGRNYVSLDGQPIGYFFSPGNSAGFENVSQDLPIVAALPPPPLASVGSGLYWLLQEFSIPAGTHVLQWSVEKESSYIGPIDPPPTAILYALDEFSVTPLGALSRSSTLAIALDQPAWTFTTNRPDSVRPTTTAALSHDHTDAVLLAHVPYEGPSTLSLNVQGGGILRYHWRGLGGNSPQPRIQIGGIDAIAGGEQGTDGWMNAWVIVPPHGATTVTWSAQQNTYLLDEMSFTPTLTADAALGAPGLTWTMGGPTPWIGVPTLSSTQSQEVLVVGRKDENNWLETTVTGPGRLTFDTKRGVSNNTEDPGSFFSFDGVFLHKIRLAGEFGFLPGHYTLIVPPGTHRIRWQQNPAERAGSWISLRNVSYVPSVSLDPVAEALDAPTLPWLIQGDASGWQLETDRTTDGQDALRYTAPSGSTSNGTLSALSTVLPQFGTATYNQSSQGRFMDDIQTQFPGKWRTHTIDLWEPMIQVVTFDINYRQMNLAGPDIFELDRFAYTPSPATLEEALDQPGQVWETSPGAPFIGYHNTATSIARDGVDAVTVQGATAGAWLQTHVVGPARVSFYTRDTGGDFFLDGTQAMFPQDANWNSGWNLASFEVGEGSHLLRWEKNGPSGWMLD